MPGKISFLCEGFTAEALAGKKYASLFHQSPLFTLSDLSWRGRVCKDLQLPFRENTVAFGCGAFKQESVPMTCIL